MSSPIWSIWNQLPGLARLFVMLLSIVSLYTFYSAAAVLLGLRSLAKQQQSVKVSVLRCSAERFQARCANLRQVLGATFYFFGFTLFLLMSSLARIADESHTPLGMLVLDNFLIYSAFAMNMFAVFTSLHLLQWFVAARTHSLVNRLSNDNLK